MEKPYVIGIDIGGTNTVFGVVDARGTILYSGSIKTGHYDDINDYVQSAKRKVQKRKTKSPKNSTLFFLSAEFFFTLRRSARSLLAACN